MTDQQLDLDAIEADRATLKNAPRDSEDWDDKTWAAWWRTAERVHGDTALPAPVEVHVVADDSDDPEHVDDCPGCETARP